MVSGTVVIEFRTPFFSGSRTAAKNRVANAQRGTFITPPAPLATPVDRLTYTPVRYTK